MNSTAPAAAVYVPPYLTVSPDDHRANLWVVTLLCLSLTNLALLARAMVKLRFDLRLAADDYSILASYILAVVQYALLIVALTKGLGTKSPENMVSAERYFYLSQIVLLGALHVSKCSMVLVLKRLFAFSHSINVVLVGFIITGVAAVLTASANCMIIYENVNSHCSHWEARWIIITALDVATEATLFILSIFYLWPIRLKTYDKAKVILAFSTRLINIAFAILFIRSYSRKSDNPDVAIVEPAVFQQCSLAVSMIIVVILPIFRLLFQTSELVPHYRGRRAARKATACVATLTVPTETCQRSSQGTTATSEESNHKSSGERTDGADCARVAEEAE